MYSIRKTNSFSGKASGLFALFIVLIYNFIVVKDINIGERIIMLRYWEIFLSGFLAVVQPYLLFPHENLSIMQLLNPGSASLFKFQLKKQIPVLLGIVLVFFTITFFSISNWDKFLITKGAYFLDSLLFTVGLFTYSFRRYIVLGQESQAYQEGMKGEKLREYGKETGQMTSSLGSLPTMQSTILIGALGMLGVVLGAYLSQTYQMNLGWIPGLALLILGLVPFRNILRKFDRFFYQTNAFYTEYFISSVSSKTLESSSYSYDAVYWIPKRWRANAWASILQLDRAYPLGRFVLLGHLLLWILFYHSNSAFIRDGYLFIFIIFHNISLFFLTNNKLGSAYWNHYLQGNANWIITRFFIQIRWLLPLTLSLVVLAIFSSHFNLYSMIVWIAIYLIISFLSSSFFTLFHEYRQQKSYE